MIFSCRYVLRAQTPDRLPAAQAAPQTRTVWDSVYTEEQAKRGGDVYYSQCSTCHGEKLEGLEDAPSLAGKEFLAAWNGRTVGALFEKTRKMPRDNPGRLDRQQYLDVVAYILSASKFPAGQTELPRDLAPLKLLRIDATNPETRK
jgi:mono/diheme cytochrome c family protein